MRHVLKALSAASHVEADDQIHRTKTMEPSVWGNDQNVVVITAVYTAGSTTVTELSLMDITFGLVPVSSRYSDVIDKVDPVWSLTTNDLLRIQKC